MKRRSESPAHPHVRLVLSSTAHKCARRDIQQVDLHLKHLREQLQLVDEHRLLLQQEEEQARDQPPPPPEDLVEGDAAASEAAEAEAEAVVEPAVEPAVEPSTVVAAEPAAAQATTAEGGLILPHGWKYRWRD